MTTVAGALLQRLESVDKVQTLYAPRVILREPRLHSVDQQQRLTDAAHDGWRVLVPVEDRSLLTGHGPVPSLSRATRG